MLLWQIGGLYQLSLPLTGKAAKGSFDEGKTKKTPLMQTFILLNRTPFNQSAGGLLGRLCVSKSLLSEKPAVGLFEFAINIQISNNDRN